MYCFERVSVFTLTQKHWPPLALGCHFQVQNILQHVTTSRIHIKYAQAREKEGKYAEAATSYERGKDYDNAIRMHLDHLRDPDEAVRVVRASRSVSGALMIAKFFEKNGDYQVRMVWSVAFFYFTC